jgi:hypothetical protein
LEKKVVNIQPPMGGLYKRQGYQQHPPFTTPDCSNVRPDNSLEGRERIGARPGVVDHGAGESWSEGNVRLISQVRYIETSSGAWVTKLVVVVGQQVWYKTGNETAQWTKVVTADHNPISAGVDSVTSAEMHQKLYIADGDTNYPIKVFDPQTSRVDEVRTGGTVEWTDKSAAVDPPTKCNIIVRYHDRLLVCEDSGNPNLWYMSRSGVPLDFNYDDTDALAAIYAQNTSMGQLGEPIRAAAPHGDQCVIFFCDSSVWSLRSDPGFGGRLDNLSHQIGCVSRNAWCRSSEGWLFWLSQEGVCAMQPGCGDTPISISRERIPDDLLFIHRDDYHVSMEYDMRHRGLHLYVTSKASAASKHYWIDIKQVMGGDKGSAPTYWPLTLSNDPTSTGVYEGAAGDNLSDVLFGSAGPTPTVKQFDERVSCEAASYCDFGPLSTTGRRGSYTTGSVDQINAVTASSAAGATGEPVTWSIRTGKSPEEAFDSTARDSGTWRYHNNSTRLRVRDPYYVLRVAGAADKNWALENMSAVIQPRTKLRFDGG